ncbi:hypothetical protein C3H94_00745 [Campylobacter jejuni]|uniref:hypothetical protein n=1 Tax=Campylobacter jejuni TaxID=197 RepID=UPI000F8075CE|nr:hypothetical protein [Campylobacter jejuni]RTJ08662.1 hypothetical protein C3H94_00745 [Campylobacter jejuni]
MNRYKKWILIVFCIPLPFILALGILLYIYDPYQFYHKPYFRETTFIDDMRLQARAVIKFYDYNSYILGSSILRATSAEEANEKLGNKWANISIYGSKLNERKIILDYIFSQKPETKNIIYSLDSYLLVNIPDKKVDFDFIYDQNFFNKFKIYINQKFLLCALQYSTKCTGGNLEQISQWLNDRLDATGIDLWLKHANSTTKKIIINNYIKQGVNSQFKTKENVNINNNIKYIQKYLITFFKSNPQTHFYLIIPPESRLFWRSGKVENYFDKDSGLFFSKYKTILKWFIQETQKYPNVKIYGFDDLDFPSNLTYYVDAVHYIPKINSMQLDAIKNHTHILTPQNMDQYFKTMEEKIKNYDLNRLTEKIKKMEKYLHF